MRGKIAVKSGQLRVEKSEVFQNEGIILKSPTHATKSYYISKQKKQQEQRKAQNWILFPSSSNFFSSSVNNCRHHVSSPHPPSSSSNAFLGLRSMSGSDPLPGMRSIRIPGDGRCLFRSVAHGAYLRAGKPSPSESLQKELADELREKVAEEFIRRRADTEWFLEGDFNEYVRHMRKPYVWGGEPELLMCSHVLKLPITVYMHTEGSDCLKIIAEYGQEYGKDNPIRVLYHGYGHYDVLQVPLARTQSKLYTR